MLLYDLLPPILAPWPASQLLLSIPAIWRRSRSASEGARRRDRHFPVLWCARCAGWLAEAERWTGPGNCLLGPRPIMAFHMGGSVRRYWACPGSKAGGVKGVCGLAHEADFRSGQNFKGTLLGKDGVGFLG